jgi:hypothetical protein
MAPSARTARFEWFVASAVALASGFALLTLALWPPPPATAVAEALLAGDPEWWQFRVVAAVGILLSVAPSYVIYGLDAFFRAHEAFRYPVVAILLAIEVLAISAVAFYIARAVRHARSKD